MARRNFWRGLTVVRAEEIKVVEVRKVGQIPLGVVAAAEIALRIHSKEQAAEEGRIAKGTRERKEN